SAGSSPSTSRSTPPDPAAVALAATSRSASSPPGAAWGYPLLKPVQPVRPAQPAHLQQPEEATVKTYKTHRCDRTHRTVRAFWTCASPRAAWVVGSGPYAVIAWCRVPTVALHEHLGSAQNALRLIDNSACGGACTQRHEIVR